MVDTQHCMAVEKKRERYTLVNKWCSVFAKPKDSFKAC